MDRYTNQLLGLTPYKFFEFIGESGCVHTIVTNTVPCIS